MFWVREGQPMEVTDIKCGYGHEIRKQIWDDKIEKVLSTLRSWIRVKTSQFDRAILFRTFAMSLNDG
eukprot:SAG31_NODE_1516_length_8036_cov_2.800680_4_plen_67_part_00